MKYYLYIADAKVDMLLPQIPYEKKKKISTEFKFDLKVLSASRRSEAEIVENRITRLEAVCQFIREYGDLGTIDKPRTYVSDSIDLTMCVDQHKDDNFVYFYGKSERTAVFLGGSSKHLLGSLPPQGVMLSNSHLNMIFWHIKDLLKDFSKQREWGNTDPLDSVCRVVANIVGRGPMQHLEFMARTLAHGAIDPEKMQSEYGRVERVLRSVSGAILATPLYVAIPDETDSLVVS